MGQEMMNVWTQAKNKFALSVPFIPLRPLKASFFMQPTDSNSTLFLKHPPRHTQKGVGPNIWAPSDPVMLTSNVTRHKSYLKNTMPHPQRDTATPLWSSGELGAIGIFSGTWLLADTGTGFRQRCFLLGVSSPLLIRSGR